MEKTSNSEEAETARKRRSSILKSRKSRNPLEEIAVSETSPNLTVAKPVRRVSFASSNFIKPFVADGEHNTIWDNTIEEDVNHTNSTQSSQEQISGSSSRMDLTISKKMVSLLNTTVLDESMMEFTCHDVAKKIENNLISTCNDDDDVFLQEVEMDLTSVSDFGGKNDNQQIKTNEQSAVDMEFTCQIPISKMSNTVAMETMELTCQQSILCQISTIPERNDVRTMNSTSQITATEGVDKENVVNERHNEVPIVNCEMPQLSNTMEFTCQMTELSVPKVSCQTPNIEKVEVIDKENIGNVRHSEVPTVNREMPQLSNTMEFTCQMAELSVPNVKCQTPNIKKVEVIDKENIVNVGQSEVPVVNCEMPLLSNTDSQTMEFTCQMPKLSIAGNKATQPLRPISATFEMNSTSEKVVNCEMPQLSNSMEFTCQVADIKCQTPNIKKVEVIDKENIVSVKHSQIPIVDCGTPHLLKITESSSNNAETMEFTCQMPKLPIIDNKQTESLCQTSAINDVNTMNSTCQNPDTAQVVKEKRAKLRYSEVPIVNCASPQFKINRLSETVSKNMKYPCQIPTTPDVKSQIKDSQISVVSYEMSKLSNNEQLQLTDTEAMEISYQIPDKSLKCQIPFFENSNVVDKENMSEISNVKPNLSKVGNNSTEFLCQVSDTDKENTAKLKHSETPVVNYEMPLKNETLEYSCQIPTTPDVKCLTQKTKNFEEADKENIVNLRHSQIPIIDRGILQVSNINKLSNSESTTMEFTCEMPKSRVGNKAKQPLHPVSATEMNSTSENVVPENTFKVTHSEVVNREMAQLSNTDTQTMEFTCQIPKLSIVGNKSKQPLRQISAISETNSTSEKVPESTVKVRHSEVVNCEMPQVSNTDTQAMEFTCEMPKLSIVGNKLKQPLCQISAMSEMNSTSEKVPESTVKVRHSEVVNCEMPQVSNTDTQAMEFTCEMPKLSIVGNKLKQPLRQISAMSEMNSTSEKAVSENTVKLRHSEVVNCEMPQLPNTNTQTMEFTCQIPKFAMTGYKATKSSASPEMTNLKARDKHTVSMKLSETISDSRRNMSICQLSSVNNSQISAATPIKEINCQNSTITLKKPQILRDVCFNETPEPSFHINLTNFTLNDDTQQLINHELGKVNPCSFTTTHLETSMGLDDVSLLNVQKNRLMNINDTYCLKNKMALKYEEEDSLGILPDECLSEIKDKPESKKYDFDKFRQPKPKKELIIKDNPNLGQIVETVRKQRGFIKKYLENFKCREIEVALFKKRPPVESPVKEEKLKQNPTVEETVRKYEESAQKCWRLEAIADGTYHISTLFKWVVLNVQLDGVSGVIQSIEFSPKLEPNSKPIKNFIAKYFIQKLKDSHLKSALGRNYDILSLLDYVKMTVLEIRNFYLDYFSIKWMVFGSDFVATYKIMEVELELLVDVRVDMNDVDNIDYNKHVTIVNKIGSVNKQELLNFAKDCPKGLAFFKSFSESIGKYVKAKEQRKGISK